MPCSFCRHPNRDSVPTQLLSPEMHVGARICAVCDAGTRSNDRDKRAQLIARGDILPLEMRPTLRMRPGERERYEREAMAHYREVS